MSEEKLFTKEAVVTAVRLTAQVVAGVAERGDALKALESLPETLADLVIEETTKANKMRVAEKAKVMSKIFGVLANSLNDGEKEG